jgi:hypothetical protein
MAHFPRLLIGFLALACVLTPGASGTAAARKDKPEPAQETGFLNRKIELHGVTYRFQVYLPEDWHRDDHKLWPIILALHGRGERGSEGMWQTQIGLPQAVRDHPERWPFVIVMPQCPLDSVWTDPECWPWPWPPSTARRGVPRRPGAHLPHRPLAGRLRRMGAGPRTIRIAGRPSPLPPAASSGATRRSAGRRCNPARRIRPRRRPHAGLAFPRSRRPGGPPRESELMFDALESRRRPCAPVDLPGHQARLLDPRLQRAGAARWLLAHRAAPANPGLNGCRAPLPGRAPGHSLPPARHQAHPRPRSMRWPANTRQDRAP